MKSNQELKKITNRKIGQCFGELREVGYKMPPLAEQCVMKWFHYLSQEVNKELSNNKEHKDAKEINYNR